MSWFQLGKALIVGRPSYVQTQGRLVDLKQVSYYHWAWLPMVLPNHLKGGWDEIKYGKASEESPQCHTFLLPFLKS